MLLLLAAIVVSLLVLVRLFVHAIQSSTRHGSPAGEEPSIVYQHQSMYAALGWLPPVLFPTWLDSSGHVINHHPPSKAYFNALKRGVAAEDMEVGFAAMLVHPCELFTGRAVGMARADQ